jgi:hypothetical protein
VFGTAATAMTGEPFAGFAAALAPAFVAAFA